MEDLRAMRKERDALLEKLYTMTKRQKGAAELAIKIRRLDLALGERNQYDVRKAYPKAVAR